MGLDPSVQVVAETWDKVRDRADQLVKATAWHHLAENECRLAVRKALARDASWADIALYGFDGMPENEARAWYEHRAIEDEPES